MYDNIHGNTRNWYGTNGFICRNNGSESPERHGQEERRNAEAFSRACSQQVQPIRLRLLPLRILQPVVRSNLYLSHSYLPKLSVLRLRDPCLQVKKATIPFFLGRLNQIIFFKYHYYWVNSVVIGRIPHRIKNIATARPCG